MRLRALVRVEGFETLPFQIFIENMQLCFSKYASTLFDFVKLCRYLRKKTDEIKQFERKKHDVFAETLVIETATNTFSTNVLRCCISTLRDIIYSCKRN